ncbi:YtxH domain-containing protein [Rubrobacter xylanophilus]|uniref:YtxH domain-containing protein n=1 Tax=Rubrobacter xylanophilus TaxID=49319 RepID=UPI001C63E4A6|nr:YtxH domain-containing protein [Rubrobacter xylanophilus]
MPDKQRVRSFILGGLAGLAAGILFAPRSGREVRGSIANRVWEARDRGRERYLEAQERLRERVSREEPPPRSPAGEALRQDPKAEELRARVRELRRRLRERPEGPRDMGGGPA